MSALLRWLLGASWHAPTEAQLCLDYQRTFGSPEGERVLRHLVEGVYFQVYDGQSTEELWQHNGQRRLVQQILDNVRNAEGGRP